MNKVRKKREKKPSKKKTYINTVKRKFSVRDDVHIDLLVIINLGKTKLKQTADIKK